MLKDKVERVKTLGSTTAFLPEKRKKRDFPQVITIFQELGRYSGAPRVVPYQLGNKTTPSAISLKFVKNSFWALQNWFFKPQENRKK